MKHLFYVPFTGLGNYGGHRGGRWLRNRISVFKQFVVPALQRQSEEIVLWVSWRREDRGDRQVEALKTYLDSLTEFKTVFTYGGVCFWDDKYPDDIAHNRLAEALHQSTHEFINALGDAETILMTIQPSDDLYAWDVSKIAREVLSKADIDAIGFTQGYIMNYTTGELAEYNPKTNPPFFTIKFPRATFLDPILHMEHTGPYKSHEYVGDKLRYLPIPVRKFLVGTHGENISTHFNHPYKGRVFEGEEKQNILNQFSITNPTIHIPLSLRKWIMRKLPHRWQRKLRYIFGEKFFNRIYNFIRN